MCRGGQNEQNHVAKDRNIAQRHVSRLERQVAALLIRYIMMYKIRCPAFQSKIRPLCDYTSGEVVPMGSGISGIPSYLCIAQNTKASALFNPRCAVSAGDPVFLVSRVSFDCLRGSRDRRRDLVDAIVDSDFVDSVSNSDCSPE